MADNTINTGAQTSGEFAITYQQSGYGGVIPVVDGVPQPSLMFGYASESDKKACMKLLEEALRATKGNVYEARSYIMNAVTIAANEIKPDEAVMINGVEILINYEERKAYNGAREIANLDDLRCELPKDAIKTILVDRAELVMEAEREDYEYGYLGEDDEEEDFE